MKPTRIPVHMEAERAQGKSMGRQAVWEAIRKLGTYTLKELRHEVRHLGRSTVPEEYNKCLVKGGYVEKELLPGKGIARTARFTLVNDVGYIAPRLNKQGEELPDEKQQLMWQTMNILRVFTAKDLALHSSIPGQEVSEIHAQDYLKHLSRAEYVSASMDAQGRTTYSLINYTGGKAPMVQRTKVLFDPNLQKAICLEPLKD